MPIGDETEADLVSWIRKQIFVWRIPHKQYPAPFSIRPSQNILNSVFFQQIVFNSGGQKSPC